MGSILTESFTPITISTAKPARVCFSYAAYAKNIVEHLKCVDVPVEQGLSDEEFSAVESNFGFSFPPDLRSIIREGVPAGHGFPNWRSASLPQLQLQIDLPVLGICKEISRNGFWVDLWGVRPDDDDEAVELGRRWLKTVPVLVPIYRNFYIPAHPSLAGNPVFYVSGGEVEVWSFDLAGFFQRAKFRRRDEAPPVAPPWAATEARRIEFWTEASGGGGRRRWWGRELDGCLAAALRRLRGGGWSEQDVREMMMIDGCDHRINHSDDKINGDKAGVTWHVRMLSERLSRAGWSTEDVVYSLGSTVDDDSD